MAEPEQPQPDVDEELEHDDDDRDWPPVRGAWVEVEPEKPGEITIG
jgi:hypothetical protein